MYLKDISLFNLYTFLFMHREKLITKTNFRADGKIPRSKSCSTAFQSVTAFAHQKSEEKCEKEKEYTIKIIKKKTDKNS